MFAQFASLAPWLIGGLIEALFLSIWIFPLVIGLLLAFKILRYREWLAGLALAWSIVGLAESGDYIYNLINWSTSRFSPWINVLLCISLFAAPPLLLLVVLLRSSHRLRWGIAALIFVPLALISMRNEFVARRERDAAAYRQGFSSLGPQTGTDFVRWWRDYRGATEHVFLQGHVPEKTRVVLLTDPFSRSFDAQSCTATASVYLPPVKDPAELGNVTELADLRGCSQNSQSGIAALERSVRSYKAVVAEPLSTLLDRSISNRAVVRRAFNSFRYDPGNFNWSKAEITQFIGPHEKTVFTVAVHPIKMPPNAFPCDGPALLVGIRELANVKTVLPYCGMSWNLFQLDDGFYLAAVTQRPMPPGYEAMNPEQTNWLFRVEDTELIQLWPIRE